MQELTVDDLVALHQLGIELHGGLGSLTERAYAGVGSVLHTATYHEGVLGYAAAILCYMGRAQHFLDGNKRAAWLGCVRALEINGYFLDVTTEDAISFVERLVTGNLEAPEVADQLSMWLAVLPSPVS